MTSRVTSKLGITFFTAIEMASAVQHIERHCPGWWWSLSQRIDGDKLSMGPGRLAAFPPDVTLSLTPEGDQGYHTKHTGPNILKDNGTIVTDFIDKAIIDLNNTRGFIDETELVVIDVPFDPRYRYQDRLSLLNLGKVYSDFLKDINVIEQQRYLLTEIYLGSCDLSVDCSLRGDRPDGSKFDVSMDLTGNATLADALGHALCELKSETLTPR